MTKFLQKSMQWLGLVDDEYDDIAPYEEYVGSAATHRASSVQATNSMREDSLPSITRIQPMQRDEVLSAPVTQSSMVVSPIRQSVVRPIASPASSGRVHVVVPTSFANAQEIGDKLKANEAVVVTLQQVEHELARRIIDFCSGSAYALGSKMERVARNVFLLTPQNVEVSQEERTRLANEGLYR